MKSVKEHVVSAFKLTALVILGFGLWGCSGDDGNDDRVGMPPPPPLPTPTPTPTPALPFDSVAIFEAEGGGIAVLASQGAEMATIVDADDASLSYVTTQLNGTSPPEDDNRVVNLTLEFPEAGSWVVFARVRIGPQGASDDSFYVDSDLGDGVTWRLFNGVGGAIAPGETGYNADDAPYISVAGSTARETWLWIKLPELQFTVTEDSLTGTFSYAGREDGLQIDKFALANPAYNFTSAQVEGGLPGDQLDPPYQPSAYTPPEGQQPMAAERDKFVGNVCCGEQAINFTAYFNQVVPENAGKWASVEAERDVYTWDALDDAVALASDNGLPFRYHVLLWGSQQPAWISILPPAEQRQEIEEWFAAVAERYGDKITYLEVVNEFISQPPCSAVPGRGGYVEALGTACVEQTVNSVTSLVPADDEWIVEAFRLANTYFPSSVKFMINEYSVINENTKAARYVEVVEKLQAEDLIDVLGFQAHAFSTRGSTETMQGNLDRLAATGLPLMATELDIDSPQFANGDDDQVGQLVDYQRIFSLVYAHPSIVGVTLWGYRPGLWREAQGATLAFSEGEEKLAFRWLNGYVRQNAPAITGPETAELALTAAVGSVVADFDAPLTLAGDPIANTDTLQWFVAGGNDDGLFQFNQMNGSLVLAAIPVAGTYDLQIYVAHGQVISDLVDLQVVIE